MVSPISFLTLKFVVHMSAKPATGCTQQTEEDHIARAVHHYPPSCAFSVYTSRRSQRRTFAPSPSAISRHWALHLLRRVLDGLWGWQGQRLLTAFDSSFERGCEVLSIHVRNLNGAHPRILMCKRFHSAPHPDIQRLFSVSINRLQEFERSLAFRHHGFFFKLS